ncbi:uncharacterized protein si:ch1073-145m9.1 [Gadus morhua]|uniref:CDP-diacylglycerol--inositol 3-phosphatidyltransferase n=1 Tax=Gadus morhua TaxID=8049 RepID=A0A8C5BED7_GADMO|nr:uncharacterized protein LOC115561004 [Gadus morhua]XP_056467007.1 uncharacterized protein si:ch1073-145m9.1 isoform X2 [Gadus chalcogrammus]
MAESTMRRHVFVYWPNIIGYIRIVLVSISWVVFKRPAFFIPLYSISILLDGVDGWVARRLEQTSRFGAWLDVVVDNLSRGMLWSMLFEWGWLVTAVEWCVFVCNHSARGADWKSSFTTSPYLVRSIMAKGFKTPLGAWVIIGIHCLPLWLYGHRWGLLSAPLGLPPLIQTLGTLGLTAGRLLGLVAEVWCIWVHIKHLIDDEIEKKS